MTAIQPIPSVNSVMPVASADAPIGIFDSGIGGLSIAIEIAHYLPHEKIIYFADTAHVPYGPRDDDDIRELTAHAIEWLYRQGCKAAVVACNTASAFSLDSLRQHYGEKFPIIGLVPALKPAVLNTQSKIVAVLATPATFRGKLIKDVMQRFAQPAQVSVLSLTCLDLVPFVEAGEQMSAACLDCLKEVLDPAIQQGADYLVLGCTHYPFLKQAIRSIYPNEITLIDSGVAVARQTARVLLNHQIASTQKKPDSIRLNCFVSGGNAEQLQATIMRLIPQDLSWNVQNISL